MRVIKRLETRKYYDYKEHGYVGLEEMGKMFLDEKVVIVDHRGNVITNLVLLKILQLEHGRIKTNKIKMILKEVEHDKARAAKDNKLDAT